MVFYIIAIAVIISAILVIANRNPMASVLWLIVCLFAQACLFALLGAHLVAGLQVLLYAGAIMVLLLFVIMLLNLGKKDITFKTIAGERIIIGTGAIYLACALGMAAWIAFKPIKLKEAALLQGTVESVGEVLLTKYLVPFELVSVVLLIAIVGSIVLIKKR